MLYEWTLWPLSEVNSGTLTLEGYLYDGWNVVMISNLNPADGAHLARKWSCVWRPDVVANVDTHLVGTPVLRAPVLLSAPG